MEIMRSKTATTGNDTSFDTPSVAAAMVFVAVVGLFFLNRASASVTLSAKVG